VENAEDPDSIAARAASLGGAFDPPSDRWHHSRFAAAEFPGSNLVTDARSLARMYAAVVGDVGDCRLLKPRTVETMCVVQTSKSAAYGVPAGVTMPPFPMSLGFMRPSQLCRFWVRDRSATRVRGDHSGSRIQERESVSATS
jgi:hypothetical protein